MTFTLVRGPGDYASTDRHGCREKEDQNGNT